MRIKPQTAIVVTIAIFAIGIAVTSALGLWSTKSNKTPRRYAQNEESAGSYDPGDIRGSYTFDEISNLFNVPIEDLCAAFSVDADLADSFRCKDLESVFAGSSYDIGTGSVRMFVALYQNLPYDPPEEMYLPEAASGILKENCSLSQNQLSYLETHTVSFP